MEKFKKKIKYYYDQFLLQGTVALILSLFFLIILIVFLIGLLIYIFNPETSFFNHVWTTFLHTLDSGSLSGETGSLAYMIFMFLATVSGIFIMSLFISFILNGFQNKLENINKGKSFVYEKNHNVILGWNDNIYIIIEKLIEANKNQKRHKIVILSELKPSEMIEKMNDYVKETFSTKIIYRTGSIYSQKDLSMCNIFESKNVIILEDDLNIIKALVVLENMGFNHKSKSFISVILSDENNYDVAYQTIPDRLEVLVVNDAITRMISQACIQPGLSFVYNNLIDFEGDEFYFYKNNNLIDKTFKEVLLSLTNSSAVGIFRDHKTILNPSMKEKILPKDEIIVIATDDDTTIYSNNKPIIDYDLIINSKQNNGCKEEHIVIFGVNERTPLIIKELEKYVTENSSITIICDEDIDCEIKSNKFVLTHIKASSIDYKTIKDNISRKITNIIIFYNESTKISNRDSETLLTLLHIKQLEKELNQKFKITSEIYDVKNTEILDMAKSDDFVVSDLISNKMLTQLAENRYLNGVFQQLLSIEGSEIYVKPIKDYIKLNEEINIYTLLESVSRKDEIFIGYKLSDLGSKGIIINPGKNNRIRFKDNDFIIVIAKD